MGADGEPVRALKKAERLRCWDARDKYWDCFRENEEQKEKCLVTRKAMEELCPMMWVKHFDKNFYYKKFKAQGEKEGFVKLDEEFGKKN